MASTELLSNDATFVALLEGNARNAGVPWPAERLFRVFKVLGCDPEQDSYRDVTSALRFMARVHGLYNTQVKELRRIKAVGTPATLSSFTKELADLGFITCLVWQRDTASNWVEACGLTVDGFKALSVLDA